MESRRGVLSSAVAKIETYIEQMGDALADATDVHHDRLVNLENNCEIMIATIQTLKSRIGTAVDIGDRFAAPTLWGSTSFIAYDLAKASSDIASINAEVVIPMKETITHLRGEI